MAEVTLGGIRIAFSAQRVDRTCYHNEVMSTVTAGIQRTVCETCGHMEFTYEGVATGPVDRAIFARSADTAKREDDAVREAGALVRYAFHREPSPADDVFSRYRVIPKQWPAAKRVFTNNARRTVRRVKVA